MTTRRISRRKFLKGAAAAVSGLAAFSTAAKAGVTPVAGKDNFVRGRKLNIACVGCGGKGSSDVDGVASENIVAVCDVDCDRAYGIFQRFPKAPRYRDFRKMLANHADEIDAVTVSTPDHTHFPAAMMAIEMGKHAFVQKPLTHTIWEARQLAQAAKKHNVATQMGNQGHANEGTRLVYEWINSGMVGPVKEVHLWTNRPIWPQNIPLPQGDMEPPPSIDWNVWLGTGPVTPYSPDVHPFKWRGFWEYGCGALGDMGCHIMDAAFWALHLAKRPPLWVEAQSDAKDPGVTPSWSIITYHFPSGQGMPPLKLVWYDGGKLPTPPPGLDIQLRDNGQLFIGEMACIMADTYCGSVRIVPEAKMKEIGRPPRMVDRVEGGHYQEWIRACKGEKPAGSNFIDHAGPLTEMVLLGNLAIRSGKRVDWDAVDLVSTNVAEANQYVREPYRLF